MNEPGWIRHRVLGALRENPLVWFRDDHAEAMDNPGADIFFEDLGMDSLARMELSIWIELEFDIEITAAEIGELRSLNTLAGFLTERCGDGSDSVHGGSP